MKSGAKMIFAVSPLYRANLTVSMRAQPLCIVWGQVGVYSGLDWLSSRGVRALGLVLRPVQVPGGTTMRRIRTLCGVLAASVLMTACASGTPQSGPGGAG